MWEGHFRLVGPELTCCGWLFSLQNIIFWELSLLLGDFLMTFCFGQNQFLDLFAFSRFFFLSLRIPPTSLFKWLTKDFEFTYSFFESTFLSRGCLNAFDGAWFKFLLIKTDDVCIHSKVTSSKRVSCGVKVLRKTRGESLTLKGGDAVIP